MTRHEENEKSENSQIKEREETKVRKRIYSAPKLYVYGQIERQTQGGSGMAMESAAMEMTKFP